MNSCRRLVPLLALAVWALSSGIADAQTTLRYKYVKGEVNSYEMLQDMKIAQNIAGMKIETQMKQIMELSMTIDEVLADGNAKVTTKFTRVKMEMNAPAPIGNVVIDSANPEAAGDNPLGKIMGGMIKTLSKVEFTGTMTPQGETIDFKIPKALVDEFRNMPGGAQMGDMFSEEGLKNMMSQSSLTFPKEPVTSGSKWSKKVATKLPFGKMSGEMKYTYKGEETVAGKKFEKIDFLTDTDIQPGENTPITIKLTGQKGSGTVLFDNVAGRLLDITIDQTMEMSVGVAGQNIDQRIDQKVTMKLKTK